MSIIIGTSGWTYKHWFDGVFYPSDLPKNEAFNYYQSKFDTVELNVTYYRLLPLKTFEHWRVSSKNDFVFSIKGSRYIVLNKKLGNPEQALERFFTRSEGLKEKAGPVLWQLPPNFKADEGRLENFLSLLPGSYRHAFEFRNESWFNEKTYSILKRKKAALVIADSPKWPQAEEITADFIYIRFHGGRMLYSSEYTSQEISDWAKKIKRWHEEGKDVYAYFNNDYMGYAPKNALELKKIVGS